MNAYRNLCFTVGNQLRNLEITPAASANPENAAQAAGRTVTLQQGGALRMPFEQGHVSGNFLNSQLCRQIINRTVVTREHLQLHLDQGADLNRRITIGNFRECNPLHFAAMSGNGRAVAAILAVGGIADINEPDGSGFSPLALICGANTQNPIHYLPFAKKVEEIRARKVGLCALLNASANQHRVDGKGCKPIHHAAENNYPELIVLLYQHGSAQGIDAGERAFDLNCTDNAGNTPLHKAAGNSQLHASQKLLKLGACVDARNKQQQTPLHEVCMHARDYAGDGRNFAGETACLLLESGADPYQQNKRKETPLDVAAKYGKAHLLSYIAENNDTVLRDKHSKLQLVSAARSNAGVSLKSGISPKSFLKVSETLRNMRDMELTSLEWLSGAIVRRALEQSADGLSPATVSQLSIPRDIQSDLLNNQRFF